MRNFDSDRTFFKKALFLTSLIASVAGALLLVAAAYLGLPVITWGLLYVSLAGFIIVLLLGADSLVRVILEAVKGRTKEAEDPESEPGPRLTHNAGRTASPSI